MKKIIVFFLVVAFVLPTIALARIGVGVGVGKIEIDETLKPGGFYDLTSLVIINTGDEPADYEITVAYHFEQLELRPAKEWFSFSPAAFYLKPNEVQNVAVKLTLPVNAKPGDYFAYLQGQPKTKVNTTGGATIGVAAATKLYFSIVPSNIFQGIYYRFIFLYSLYHPWDTIVLAIIFVAILVRFIGKRFKFKIARK